MGGEVVALLPDDHPGQSELKWSRNAFKPFLIIDPQVRGVRGGKEWVWGHCLRGGCCVLQP